MLIHGVYKAWQKLGEKHRSAWDGPPRTTVLKKAYKTQIDYFDFATCIYQKHIHLLVSFYLTRAMITRNDLSIISITCQFIMK